MVVHVHLESYWQYYSKNKTKEKGIFAGKLNTWSPFVMKNLYIKFQNPYINIMTILAEILK